MDPGRLPPTPVTPGGGSHWKFGKQTPNDEFVNELDAVLTWFSALDDAERAAAFRAVTRLPTRRELAPMIRILQDRERRTLRLSLIHI